MKAELTRLQLAVDDPNKIWKIHDAPLNLGFLKAKLTEFLELETGFDIAAKDPMQSDNGVALIDIKGTIYKGTGLPQAACDFLGICDLVYVDQQLKAAINDPSITSVVLLVESPGGYISGIQTTANLVSQLASEKETVVFTENVNASAAYEISSQANSIFTSIDARIGAVGVYMENVSYSRALQDQGIDVTLLKAGKWKGIGSPSQPLTDEQKAFLQDGLNKEWALFKANVTAKRPIAEADMEGQVFSNSEAVTKGFSDGITTFDEVMNVLTA